MSDNTITSVLERSPKKVGKVTGSGKKKPVVPAAASAALEKDSVEISNAATAKLSSMPSEMAKYLRMLRDMPEVRGEKISAAKKALESGAYDEKALHATADGVAEELGILLNK